MATKRSLTDELHYDSRPWPNKKTTRESETETFRIAITTLFNQVCGDNQAKSERQMELLKIWIQFAKEVYPPLTLDSKSDRTP